MALPKRKPNAADALASIASVAMTSFVLATLYFAREILIPFALSALLTFLLSPLVTRLERWLGRVAAVLVVVLMIFAGTGLGGWILTRQLIDLAARLPDYKDNIAAKIHEIQLPKGGAFTAVSKTFEELKKELPGGSASVPLTGKNGEPARPGTASSQDSATSATVSRVEVVEAPKASPMDLLRTILAPVVGPLGTAALVLLLVIFMLLQREDLRNRLIRLIGHGHISATRRALDDAGQRVASYLLMQLVVNVTYGLIIATGLYFIGVPNYALWGAFGTVLRFIPYIGPWIAAIFPTLLALAVSPHWTMPVLTITLFGGVELVLNNVMEPLLYGKHTGVSSIALIIAAVFWTWLWGAVGLVLATPLTVCLVVIGRHVPRLAFLGVLLSDEEALTPAEDYYHRLLTPGEQDEIEFVENFLKTNTITALYDIVFIPAMTSAETDFRTEALEPAQLAQVEQSLREIVEDLGTRPQILAAAFGEDPASPPPAAQPLRVACLPARAERDELAGTMLAQLLPLRGCTAWAASSKLVAGELIGQVETNGADVVCISVVAPSTVLHARYLCLKLRAQYPHIAIVIGLWAISEGADEASKRLREAGASEVVATLAEAVAAIVKFSPVFVPDPVTPGADAAAAAGEVTGGSVRAA